MNQKGVLWVTVRRPQLVSWPVWNLEEKGRSVGVHQKGRAGKCWWECAYALGKRTSGCLGLGAGAESTHPSITGLASDR